MTDTTAAPAAPLPAPRDNLFGVCAAIGEDFGVNPLWLRLAFAVALLFNLELVAMTYAALGVLVLASRLLFPNRKVAAADEAPASVPVAAEAEEPEYRKAA